MGKYLHLFESVSAFTEAYNGEGYEEPWVSYVEEVSGVQYNKGTSPVPPGPSTDTPLTFEIISGGNIYWTCTNKTGCARTIEYRKKSGEDGEWGEWTSITSTSAGTAIPVVAGDILEFRGDNENYYISGSTKGGSKFDPTTGTSQQNAAAIFNVYGNIMSLISKTGYAEMVTLPGECTFKDLFIRSKIYDASELLLPATALTYACYNCTFKDCTLLESAPALPATVLADSCYYGMFNNCPSLTTAPILSAKTLVTNCYGNMFLACTNLNRIECMATNISASNCTSRWVENVSATGTFVKASGMSGWGIGTSGIPQGWVVQDTDSLAITPERIVFPSSGQSVQVSVTSTNPWTASADSWITLSQLAGGSGTTVISVTVSSTSVTREGYAYFNSGENSATLAVIQEDAAAEHYLTFNITSPGYINWLSSGSTASVPIMYSVNNGEWTQITSSSSGTKINGLVAGDTIQVKAPDGVTRAGISSGENSYSTFSGSTAGFNLEGNVMSLLDSENYESIKQITQSFAFAKLFAYCTGLTSAENLNMPATAVSASAYREMFQDCSSLTTPPQILPATSLADSCYRNMFAQSGVISGPELPAETLVESCYRMMFYSATTLNYIKCLATDKSATNATSAWTQSVASSGMFVKPSSISVSTWGTGVNGIPTNWVVMDEDAGEGPDYTLHESTNLVHSEILRIPDSLGIRQFNENGGGRYSDWTYTDGIFLKGVIDTYIEYNSDSYDLSSLLEYVGHYYGTKINSSGAIDSNYDNTQLDDKEPAMALFKLYDLTGLEKYKLCLDMLYDNDFSTINKNIDGVFYHKVTNYPRQGWLDGLYMGEPFRAEYAKRFLTGSAQAAVYDDVVYQITKLTEKTYDSATGLYRHAYDSSAREGADPASWVDPNSVSGEQAYYAWSRALGWALMAIVDVLEILPDSYTGRTSLTNLLSGMCQGILTYRDSSTGVWRNVLTEPATAGTVNQNGFESSSSAMFAYAWLKGVRLGYLPISERSNAISIYQSIKSNFFGTETYHGETTLTYSSVCSTGNPGTGCDTKAKVYANYCSKEFFDNNTHGFAPAIYAALEYERLTNS